MNNRYDHMNKRQISASSHEASRTSLGGILGERIDSNILGGILGTFGGKS